MAGPPSLGERVVLRVLWAAGRVGLGGLVTRFYLWTLATVGPVGMGLVFKGYTPQPHDVFVCTVAKSGTNWMMQLVTQIADHGQAEFDDIHDIVPWPEAPLASQVAPLTAPVTSRSGLRALKTHVPAQHVPFSPEARYVVVVRDPKDVFVSSWFFVGGIVNGIWGAPPALDDWYRRWVERRFPLGSWAEHTAGWWARRHEPNVAVFTFAELKADLPGCVDRLAAWMGVSLSEAERSAVVERSGFAWMKAHAHQFQTPVPSVGGQRAVMIREGKRGSSRELLTEAQWAEIDRVCREELAERGSDFPYDEAFATG